ncbi:MAG: 3'-5' exonuclease [Bacteroidota bacterium]|nr:3'-5' exonuclease [Bacteroidota bacterium]
MVNNRYPETLTAEDLGKYEVSWFKGEISVVEDMEEFRSSFPKLVHSAVLGFDTETKPSFRKGYKNKVSLIQLATEDFACLIRINKIGMPQELVDLLANPAVIKAGVAVHDDIRFLRSVRKFNPSGFVDLQKLVKEFGIQSSGLKKLSAIILGFRISKGQQVTNWEADQLTEAQLVYAATDAWVCHQIYRKLMDGSSYPLPSV